MFPPQLIVADRIGNNLELGSKKRLLQVLGELLAAADPVLAPEDVFEHLLERERLGSTGLGHGVALPHARMQEVTDAIGAFVRLPVDVDFDAVDKAPVDLVFGLLVPEEADEVHLQLLSQLATMFSDPGFRQELRNVESSQQIHALLAGWDENEEDQS